MINNYYLHCGLLGATLMTAPVYAVEPLVPYDDFNAPLINPDNGLARNQFSGPGIGLEASRQIQSGRLAMSYRGYGDTASDSGFTASQFTLRVRNTLAVTALKGTLNVPSVTAIGCASSPNATFTRVSIGGNWFNTVAPVPNSRA